MQSVAIIIKSKNRKQLSSYRKRAILFFFSLCYCCLFCIFKVRDSRHKMHFIINLLDFFYYCNNLDLIQISIVSLEIGNPQKWNIPCSTWILIKNPKKLGNTRNAKLYTTLHEEVLPFSKLRTEDKVMWIQSAAFTLGQESASPSP